MQTNESPTPIKSVSVPAVPPAEPAPTPGPTSSKPDNESIRAVMREAWMDHHNTREQSWKTIHMAVILFVGMVAIRFDPELGKMKAITVFAGLSVCFVTFIGIFITCHHRKVERDKRRTIKKCEKKLHVCDLIPKSRQKWRGTTALFIMSIHVLLFIMTIFYLFSVLHKHA